MNEIMLTSDNLMPIETQNRILSIEKQLTELKKAEETLKSALLEEMTKRNIKKIETERLTITYVDESTRETFDSKRFKEEHKVMYNQYARISTAKAYVKIGVNNADKG